MSLVKGLLTNIESFILDDIDHKYSLHNSYLRLDNHNQFKKLINKYTNNQYLYIYYYYYNFKWILIYVYFIYEFRTRFEETNFIYISLKKFDIYQTKYDVTVYLIKSIVDKYLLGFYYHDPVIRIKLINSYNFLCIQEYVYLSIRELIDSYKYIEYTDEHIRSIIESALVLESIK